MNVSRSTSQGNNDGALPTTARSNDVYSVSFPPFFSNTTTIVHRQKRSPTLHRIFISGERGVPLRDNHNDWNWMMTDREEEIRDFFPHCRASYCLKTNECVCVCADVSDYGFGHKSAPPSLFPLKEIERQADRETI